MKIKVKPKEETLIAKYFKAFSETFYGAMTKKRIINLSGRAGYHESICYHWENGIIKLKKEMFYRIMNNRLVELKELTAKLERFFDKVRNELDKD